MSIESPFSPDALLASLREMSSPGATDPALKQRMQSRLAVSLVGLAPVATEPGTAAPPASTLGGVAGSSAKGGFVAWLAPVFVAGALSGVVADRLYIARHVPVTGPIARHFEPAPVAAAAPPAVAEATVEQLERVGEVVATVPLSNPASASAEPGSSMAAERQLLDAARTALARGEPEGGIAYLEKHVKRFPKGLLTEEREALYVRILVAMGNDNAASARAASFQRHFPNSIFMPVVERAVASIARRIADGKSKPQ